MEVRLEEAARDVISVDPLCGAVRRHNRQDFLTTSSKLMEISQRDIKRVSCNQIFGLYYKVYSFLVSCFLKSPASSGGFPGRFMPPFPRRARRTRQYQLHPHVLVSPFPESTVFYNSLYPLPPGATVFSLGKTRTLEPPNSLERTSDVKESSQRPSAATVP